jgi:hypothetical protein
MVEKNVLRVYDPPPDQARTWVAACAGPCCSSERKSKFFKNLEKGDILRDICKLCTHWYILLVASCVVLVVVPSGDAALREVHRYSRVKKITLHNLTQKAVHAPPCRPVNACLDNSKYCFRMLAHASAKAIDQRNYMATRSAFEN